MMAQLIGSALVEMYMHCNPDTSRWSGSIRLTCC